jgi:hypothetical protein
MEKDEIGFDLALISKFVTKKKKVCSQLATLVRASVSIINRLH